MPSSLNDCDGTSDLSREQIVFIFTTSHQTDSKDVFDIQELRRFSQNECINNGHRHDSHMALGDLAFEETGTFAGVRALPDGKVEATYQGTGKLFGVDYSSIYTGVATPQGGTLIAEFNGICTTKDGDIVGVNAHGRGRPTGNGLEASWRGGVIWQTSSPKFPRLNSVPGVWELDIDETGKFHLKVWEWK